MNDLKTSDENQISQEKEKRKRWLLILLLLLILLIIICISYSTFTRYTPLERKFISLNIDCLKCHTELLKELEMDYVHEPFLKKRCTNCHTKHGEKEEYSITRKIKEEGRKCGLFLQFSINKCGNIFSVSKDKKEESKTSEKKKRPAERSKLRSSLPELCLTCHKEEAEQFSMVYTHLPFVKGRCLECHRPHASMHIAQIKVAPENLCISCHRIAEDLDKEQIHPPFGQKQCMSCHNPHASEYSGIILSEQKILCISCHQSVATLFNMPVQHIPFVNGNCTGCHFPHSSDFKPLLIENQPPLCYNCHPEIRRDFLKISHHPVGTSILNCSDCHQPHAAFYTKLLIAEDNDLCYLCHYDKQEFYTRSKHQKAFRYAAPGLCINCHTPHGSDWAPILLNEECLICLECHKFKKPLTHQHPFHFNYIDRRIDGHLSCSSTCHNPHGTENKYMLRWTKDFLCMLCHRLRSLP